MLFSLEMVNLVLYSVQQLGVMLAIGAETIILIAYAISMRDGILDETETGFSRAIHRALLFGIVLMVLSGVATTGLHLSLGQDVIVLEPVFLFKWALILGLAGVYLWQRQKPFLHPIGEAVVAGSWYTLFMIHILAPVTTWLNLLTLYAVFLAGFVVIWMALVTFSGARKAAPVQKKAPVIQAAPKPIAPPPPPQKIEMLKIPLAPQPIKIAQAPQPAPPMPPQPKPEPPPMPHTPPAPAPTPVPEVPRPSPSPMPTPPPPIAAKVANPDHDVHHSPWLPAIHLMPKNEIELKDNKHLVPLAALTKRA